MVVHVLRVKPCFNIANFWRFLVDSDFQKNLKILKKFLFLFFGIKFFKKLKVLFIFLIFFEFLFLFLFFAGGSDIYIGSTRHPVKITTWTITFLVKESLTKPSFVTVTGWGGLDLIWYYPRHSMYGIFPYIWWIFMVVGKYTIHWVFGYVYI